MKKLGVCGDSFMASIGYEENDLDNGYDKHFTELLAKKLGWDIVTFARGACSNQTIRLQIDEVIKEKPDLVIIGLTSPDRIEFPIYDLSVSDYNDKYNAKNYKIDDGLYNIDYNDYPDKSSNHLKFKEISPKLSSETIGNMFVGNHSTKINNYDIEILQKWFQRFFDYTWKIQQDTWIISNGLRKLQDNNINFFCIINMLHQNEFSIFNNSIIDNNSNLNPWLYFNPKGNVKYRFHTSLEDQEILSDLWYEFIKNQIK